MATVRARMAAALTALTAAVFLTTAEAALLTAFVAPAAPLRIDVSTVARAVQPGEALRLSARTSVPVDRVTGRTPSGPVYFFRTDDPLVWQALLGLDLKVPAGLLALTVRAESGGESAEAAVSLRVLRKRVADRHISVDPRFAKPPADQLARIERETRLLSSVLSAISTERLWRGAFVKPVPGGPTSAFGRVSVVNGERRSPHSGIDLQASDGTPIRSPNAGRVVLSASLYYAGETVIVDHGLGVFSLLAHLSVRNRAEGDPVEAGEVVGLSGSTGRITGPHLHWGARIAGAVVDPMSLLVVTEQLRERR